MAASISGDGSNIVGFFEKEPTMQDHTGRCGWPETGTKSWKDTRCTG